MQIPKQRRSRWARCRDEKGATFVLTAICMVLLLWGGAMGVDIGFSVVGSRQAQALADTGALDMARYINLADNYAVANYNSYLNGEMSNVQSDNGAQNVTFTATGMYWSSTTGWTVPTAGQACYRQTPARNPPCTAVMVTAKETVPRIFAGGSDSVTRSAIAAITPEDGFSIGSYLASFNSQQSGVLNAILSTLGTSVNLTTVGYQGLADSTLTVQQLITASGGVLTPSNVYTKSLTAGQWLSFLTIAMDTQQSGLSCGSSPVPAACTAYTALSSLDFNGASTAELCQLVSINQAPVTEPSCPASGNLSEPDLSASLDVLQTLTTEAELANGSSALNVQSALGITGVTAATLSLNLIQPPEIAYGPAGTTTATTAQVSADLQLNLGPVLGTLNIPLSGAEGTASLTAMTCSEQNNSFGSASISASSTAATGTVTLAGTTLSTLTVGGASSTPLAFGAGIVPPTATSISGNTNPASIGTTAPLLSYSGSTGTGTVNTLLTSTLQPVLGPILNAAGVSVGGAVVTDLDYNCGAVSIVK